MATAADRIPGYRQLDDEQVALIQRVKGFEAKLNALIDDLHTSTRADPRLVHLAATHAEAAFMFAVKSVAQPERLVDRG